MNLIKDNVSAKQSKSIKSLSAIAKTGCCILLIMINSASFALPEDSKAVLEMHAGSADINQQTHQGTYLNQVELDQGTTHIRALKAITESNEKNQLTKAIIIGDQKNPAHYWAMIANNKPELHAYAETIEYYPEQHLIKLIGQARIEQGKNSFSAPIICYDTLKQHITSEQKENERTVIIFYPEKNQHESIISTTHP